MRVLGGWFGGWRVGRLASWSVELGRLACSARKEKVVVVPCDIVGLCCSSISSIMVIKRAFWVGMRSWEDR
jgi:hypothetical protein